VPGLRLDAGKVAMKRKLYEKDFQAGVIEFAQLHGWRVMHISDSRREVINRKRGVRYLIGDELSRGWPDLVLAHPTRGQFVVRELKTDKGRIRPEQKAWLETLAACGVDVGVWRPRDIEEIETLLAGRERRTKAA
jgi:hypothetical protein